MTQIYKSKLIAAAELAGLHFHEEYYYPSFAPNGLSIKPKGFKRIEIHTKELYIKADYNSFTIKDMTDMHNEPTCIPAMKGPKTSVNQFYRWIMDNQSYSQSMTYHEVLNELRKMGIDYHEYCAVD